MNHILSTKNLRKRPFAGRVSCLAIHLLWLGTIFHFAVLKDAHAQDNTRPKVDASALAREVDEVLKQHGENIQASVWLGGPEGKSWFEVNSEVSRPTASAIKTFYLVELFGRYRDKLDDELPGADKILSDDQHPAISHFTPAQRDAIR